MIQTKICAVHFLKHHTNINKRKCVTYTRVFEIMKSESLFTENALYYCAYIDNVLQFTPHYILQYKVESDCDCTLYFY